jgi:hypothetical protein
MTIDHRQCSRPVALLAARVAVDDLPLYVLWCAECGQVVEHEHSAIVIGADEINAVTMSTTVS